MNRKLATMILAVMVAPITVHAADPVVSNVRARQLDDGTKRVEVLFDLSGAPAGGATVTVAFSATGSAPYDIVPSSVSGHLGPGVTNGSNRRIVWDAGVDLPAETYGTTYRAAVTATDPDGGPSAIGLALTTEYHTELEDLDSVCESSFGQDASLADWNDVVAAYDIYGESFADQIGLSGANLSAMVQRDGNEWPTATRHYFISRHDGVTPGGFLVHAEIGGDFIDLGSWYGLNMPVLCKTTSGGNAGDTITLPGGVEMELVHIPAGTFMMGSPPDERARKSDEDLHQVTLTQGYYLGKTEVTQAQWEAVMGSNPAHGRGVGEEYPVYLISWNDICGGDTGDNCLPTSFIGHLKTHLTNTGQPGADLVRMPTEAEWERAARGGETEQTPFSFDTDSNPEWDLECGSFPEAEDYMWWCGNLDPTAFGTQPVGMKQANPFGLYDIHGNVWEWVADWYGSDSGQGTATDPTGPLSGDYRVRRGGGYNSHAENCRTAARTAGSPDGSYSPLGFRLARSEDGLKTLGSSHTGYSNLFTIDLRGGSTDEVRLVALDDFRSPSSVELHPGEVAYLYYRFEHGDGSPVTTTGISYSVFLLDSAPPPSSYNWYLHEPGIARLTLDADELGIGGGSDILSFGSGSGVMSLGGTPVTVTAVPSDVVLTTVDGVFVDEWDLFAGASAGVTGTLGVRGSVGAAEATLGAATISGSGSAGMGFHLSLEPDDMLSLSRRLELGLAANLKVPTVSGTLGPGEISATGLTLGAERGFSYEQSFAYRGLDPNSEEARMMHAAFFLEAASAGGSVTSPGVGNIIKAIVATLNGLSGAGDLVDESLRAQAVATRIAGSVDGASFGFGTPSSKEHGQQDGPSFGFEISAGGMSGALSSEVSTLYGQGGAGTAPAGWENSADFALSVEAGSIALGDMSFGAGEYTADLNRTLVLDAGRQPSTLRLSWTSKHSPEFGLGNFTASPFVGDRVSVNFGNTDLVQMLVSDLSTGLRALKGDGVGTAVFGKAAVLGSVNQIRDSALDWAGTSTAFVVETSGTHGIVISAAGDIAIPIVPPPTQFDVDLGLDMEFQQFRTSASPERAAVTGDGLYWSLASNTVDPNWLDADSLIDVLQERVFSGLGPLIREAFLNLVDIIWWPWGSKMTATMGTIEAVVTDVVRDREAGAVALDDSYLDHTGSVVSGDPSRLEVSGPAGNKRAAWAFTTRRVFNSSARGITRGDLKRSAASSSEILTLVGQFIELKLDDPTGQPVSSLSPTGTIRFKLYEDQFESMGGEWDRRNETRIFRYDPSNGGWEDIGGSVPGGGSAVEAAIDRTGAYAPGIVTTIPVGDSDGDGLTDDEEDLNGNGIVDPGESDPYIWDSDGDGVSDGDEIAAGSDPLDSESTPNRAPILAYVGNRTAFVGDALELTVFAFDPDDDEVVLSAAGLPQGAILHPTTGNLSWTPSAEGRWSVTVTAEDIPRPGYGAPLKDAETFLLIAEARPPAVATQLLVPSAVHTPGLNGTFWKTDLRIFNPGDDTVAVTIEFLPEDEDNSQSFLFGIEANLAGRSTLFIDDVAAVIPGIEGDSTKGSLRLRFGESATATLIAVSRTYNDTPDGTFGQFLPAVPMQPSETDEVRLSGLVHNLYSRTNLSFANLSDQLASGVTVRLMNHQGEVIGNPVDVVVQPYSTKQVVKISEKAGILTDLDVFSVVVDTNGFHLAVGASVVDNATGDPVYIEALEQDGGTTWIPGIAHLDGANGSVWRSDVTLFNHTDDRISARIDYISPENGQMGYQPFISLDIASGNAAHFLDVLSAITTAGVESKGFFVVSSRDGSELPQVVAKTYNVDQLGGTFGQNLAVFEEDELIPAGATAFVPGVTISSTSSAGFRTNVGLVNTSEVGVASVRLSLYRSDGQIAGNVVTEYLEPREMSQFNLAPKLALSGADVDGTVMVEVLNGGPVAAYASIVDNRTQDPVLIPAMIPSAQTVPAPPASAPVLTATVVSSTRIDLSWTEVAGATGYEVHRGSVLVYNGTERQASDTGLSPASGHCYRVRAVNTAGAGPFSASVCATTDNGGIGMTWSPISPEIGEMVTFTITGLSDDVRAEWDFGEDGCSGFPRAEICEPLFSNCHDGVFKFAAGGDTTVSVTVSDPSSDSVLGLVTRTITVQDSGSCGNGGGSCSYSITPLSMSFAANGGNGSIFVTTQVGCDWTATTRNDWIVVQSGASGQGSGVVSYVVAENDGAQRSGAITVGNKTHSVQQESNGASL